MKYTICSVFIFYLNNKNKYSITPSEKNTIVKETKHTNNTLLQIL